MSNQLVAAFAALRTKLQAVQPTIRNAPDSVPDSTSVFPFGVVYPGTGTYTQESATRRTGLHTAIVEIHTSRRDLPRDVEKLQEYGEAFPAIVWNDVTLGGAVQHINAIRYTFQAMKWGDAETVGWRFQVDFKLLGQGVEVG